MHFLLIFVGLFELGVQRSARCLELLLDFFVVLSDGLVVFRQVHGHLQLPFSHLLLEDVDLLVQLFHLLVEFTDQGLGHCVGHFLQVVVEHTLVFDALLHFNLHLVLQFEEHLLKLVVYFDVSGRRFHILFNYREWCQGVLGSGRD